jgi:myosin-18
VQSEKAWLEAEKVWLVHKGGFASASVIKGNGMSPLPEGKVRIKLDSGGDVLEVDEDDVEKVLHVYRCTTDDVEKVLHIYIIVQLMMWKRYYTYISLYN